jgi:hypothetical protein
MSNQVKLGDIVSASVERAAPHRESLSLLGHYTATCVAPSGDIKWTDEFDNVVTTLGVNLMFNVALASTQSYNVTGPFIGLFSTAGYTTGPSSGDTMASHGGWAECGSSLAPGFSARSSVVMSTASSAAISLSAAAAFSITSSGNVKGAFLVYGSGATNVISSNTGTLFSAGLFTSSDKAVSSGDTLNVSWSLTGA